MVNRKIKSKPRSIQLKGRSRRLRHRNSHGRAAIMRSMNGFLDRQVSVRSILKYSGIILAFVLVFVAVFLLGRLSIDKEGKAPSQASVQELSSTAESVEKESSPEADVEEDAEAEEDEGIADVVNLSDSEEDTEQVEDYEEADYEEEISPAAPPCHNKVAGFDYTYTNVEVAVTDFVTQKRGDNWASVESIKLTITNNEECTIINPTKIRMKLNARGKGSVWWDDDVFLASAFKHMLPGTTVSEVVPVHVTYSDIYSEKDFKATVFDDYDIPIATFRKYITFS